MKKQYLLPTDVMLMKARQNGITRHPAPPPEWAAAAALYHSETMKEINNEWRAQNTAPQDRKILAFFEGFGWYPAAWSEDDQVWKVAKCKGRPGTKAEEPEWHQVTFRDDELCWWREWPDNTAPCHRDADETAEETSGRSAYNS